MAFSSNFREYKVNNTSSFYIPEKLKGENNEWENEGHTQPERDFRVRCPDVRVCRLD
jgi:hypothetical protein